MSAGRNLSAALGAATSGAAAAVFRALDRVDADTGRMRAVEKVAARPAVTESTSRIGARRVENDWLVTTSLTGPILHHAALDGEQLFELLGTDVLDATTHPVVLTCGLTPALLASPGALDVRQTPRCRGCCAALGYPRGAGAPECDPGCEQVLEARVEALR